VVHVHHADTTQTLLAHYTVGSSYTARMEEPASEQPLTQDDISVLVANHREFLAFVQRRVGSRDVAEEILQDAFVRSVDKLDSIRDSAIGWFYRVLRNAITDYYRRNAAHSRKVEGLALEPVNEADDDELHKVVCKCVAELAATLKPEYAEALKRVEVDGVSVKDYADQAGISSNNAGVRIFRAREALRKQVTRACGTCADHGCLDCTCGKSADSP
jgi:RNA polymerase sigma-70 factor (ECF subfamily)